MKEYKIVIIDDNMHKGLSEPFVHTIAKLNPDAEIFVFIDPEKGFQFVMENLQSKLIVFLDCKFEESSLQGIDILRKIRATTALVYIVMMSANKISGFNDSTLINLINEDLIYFFDRSLDADATSNIIDKVKLLWEVRFDCVLENWINRHSEDAEKIVYIENGKSFTWQNILMELRNQTAIGKSFEKMINRFYIYQLEGKK